VIKCADWIIDMGHEGGAGGGRDIATGTPEQIVESPDRFTGHYLKAKLQPAETPRLAQMIA
jgi:excinuclease ABC subunit A